MRYLLSFVFFVGCTTSVESEKGSHGKYRHTIRCKNAIHRCYDKANDLCPDGYLVLNRVRGVEVDDDVEYTLKIRCREGKVMF